MPYKDKNKRLEYHRNYMKVWTNKHREQLLLKHVDNLEHKKQVGNRNSKAFYQRNKVKILEYQKERYNENRIKNSARNKSRYNIFTGRIKKHNCEICLDNKVVGHHSDYNKPLEVVFLCYRCHKLLHNKLYKKTNE